MPRRAEPVWHRTRASAARLALARRLLPGLLRRGALGVAVSGSSARGTAGRGSDLDLWVLRPGAEARHTSQREGINVTLLGSSPQTALTFDTLCLWEVDDLIVLADPHGHFAAVQARFARQRARIHRSILSATRQDLRHELRLAARGTAWRRVLFLRQAAFRVAAVWLFLRTGWRVPRRALLLATLPQRGTQTLESVLALPSSRVTRQALAALPQVTARCRRQVARAGGDAGGLFVPKEIPARLASSQTEEAALLARRFLSDEVLPTVLALRSHADFDALTAEDEPLRTLAAALHGFEQLSLFDERLPRRTARQVQQLIRALKLEDTLGRQVLAALLRCTQER